MLNQVLRSCDRKGTQIKENKTMTQIDRDGRAGGRVDSAITVAIRSAGGVNEGAETLKAEGATHVLLGD